MANKNESTEKGTTRELDLSELKLFLAKEEADVQNERPLIQPDKDDEKDEKIQNLEELRNERRLYWKEQNKRKQLEKTPFNYYPTFFYGGFWLRFFAYLIDLLVISSLNRLIVRSYFVLTQAPMSTNYLSLYSISKLAVFLLYFIFITKLTNGQTIGKMIFGLRVVCFKEEKLSWMTVIIREGFGRYVLKDNQFFIFIRSLYKKKATRCRFIY